MSYFNKSATPFDGINNPQTNNIHFHSRRSPVLSKYGMVASSQPIVSQVGQSILRQNGNGVDACVAMNAALAVVSPAETGLGGDCFALYYSAKDRKVYGLNGSGKTSSHCTLKNYAYQLSKTTNSNVPIKQYESNQPIDIDLTHALNITVPGNVAGMMDILEKHGTMSREAVLSPAINLATNGFPVSNITSYWWNQNCSKLIESNTGYNNHYELLMDTSSKAPQTGDIMKNEYIANTLRKIMVHGKSEYYNGSIADSIVDIVQRKGGLLTKSDLKNHESLWVEPIKINYKNCINVWEIPPNGQGIAALMALQFYQNKSAQLYNIEQNMSLLDGYAQDLHTKIECMRLSYQYAQELVSDLSFEANKNIDIEQYLSQEFAQNASKQISLNEFNQSSAESGIPLSSSDTASYAAVDVYGNGCSFISSNYKSFGTGIIPKDCGFALQCRGYNFVKKAGHSNSIGPSKRPYHTIIPGLCTKDDALYCVFSVMGGYMQPQGHFQVVSNMIDKGMDVQTALDAPRFRINVDENNKGCPNVLGKRPVLLIEDQANVDQIVRKLKKKYKHDRIQIVRGHRGRIFGRGQIIYKDGLNGVLWGGSDGRADGCAIGLESDPRNAQKTVSKL